MTGLLIALALISVPTERFYRVLCSRTDVAVVHDDDPALRYFRHRGYPLKDAKIDLAIERASACENVIAKFRQPTTEPKP